MRDLLGSLDDEEGFERSQRVWAAPSRWSGHALLRSWRSRAAPRLGPSGRAVRVASSISELEPNNYAFGAGTGAHPLVLQQLKTSFLEPIPIGPMPDGREAHLSL
jgi:hypothetical protein